MISSTSHGRWQGADVTARRAPQTVGCSTNPEEAIAKICACGAVVVTGGIDNRQSSDHLTAFGICVSRLMSMRLTGERDAAPEITRSHHGGHLHRSLRCRDFSRKRVLDLATRCPGLGARKRLDVVTCTTSRATCATGLEHHRTEYFRELLLDKPSRRPWTGL